MTGISLKVECRFKNIIIHTLVGPVVANNISNIKLGLKLLKVDILGSNNIPNKMKRQDIVTLVKSYIRVGGTVDH